MSVRETSCTAAAWLHSTGNMVACSSVGITDCHRGLYNNNYSLCRAKRRHRCTDLHHVHRLVFITTRPFLCCYIKPTSSNIITSQTRTFIIVCSLTLILMKHWYYSDETDETGTKYQKNISWCCGSLNSFTGDSLIWMTTGLERKLEKRCSSCHY